MTGAILKIRDDFGTEKTIRAPSKQAWAAYVRRRWPQNAVCHAQAEWNLTEGQARGLVFGHASQPTIDAILSHRHGGPLLALTIEASAWGLDWEAFVARAISQAQRSIANERARLDAADRRAQLAWSSVRDARARRGGVIRLGDPENGWPDRTLGSGYRGLGDQEDAR